MLLGLGWLAPSHLDKWPQGRVDSLERVIQANPNTGHHGAARALRGDVLHPETAVVVGCAQEE